MKRHIKTSALLFMLLITSGINAQTSDCIFNKTLAVKKGSTLRLSNKYGDINLINCKNDSLSVCATISINQDNEDLRKKNIKLVGISFVKINDTIQITTHYDRKFFTETNREGRKSFSVDYLINIPAYADLYLVNEFGNISMEDMSGTVAIRLSQGNLTARRFLKGNIKPVSTIYADHGKINIDELNWLSLTAKNCPSVEIKKAQALIINSVISRFRLGETGSAIIDSKSDSYIIGTINNLNSQSIYSSIDARRLSGQVKSKAVYGSIKISEIANGFSSIDITSSQSQISLNTGQNTSFRTDITTINTSVDFPSRKYPYIKRTDSNNNTYILGTAGVEDDPKSLIKIRTTGGSLTFK
jgi:hypothetical protein